MYSVFVSYQIDLLQVVDATLLASIKRHDNHNNSGARKSNNNIKVRELGFVFYLRECGQIERGVCVCRRRINGEEQEGGGEGVKAYNIEVQRC